MNSVDMGSVQDQIHVLRARSVSTSWAGVVPESITYLMTLISNAKADEKAALYPLVLSEASRARNNRAELFLLHQQVKDLPDDPLAKASLAYGMASRGMGQEALDFGRQAIALARGQDRQVKYTATNFVRVGLLLDDYGAINEGLELLVSDAVNRRSEDHGPEFDFLPQLDVKRVPAMLLRSYEALQSKT